MKGSKLKKLIAIVKLAYEKSPFYLRWFFSLMMRMYKIIYLLDHKLRTDIWIISGKEPLRPRFTIIFAGREQNKNYLANLAFDSISSEIHIGKTWKWKLIRTISKKSQDSSLMVMEVNKSFLKFFDRRKTFFVPCWIGQEADISNDTSSFKKYERQINKYNLQFEVTNDRCRFDKFYHDMYLPYIINAHGNKAFPMTYYDMEKEVKNCDLLLIKKNKEYIAGQLIVYEKNGPRLWSLGVKDGDTDYLKMGVIVAIDYFAIMYLKQKGYKTLHFGASRAFLKDGVLQYKKRWKLRVINGTEAGFLIKPLSESIEVKGFFLKNPFIYLDQDSLNGAIFMENDQLRLKEDFEKIFKDYYLKGLSRLNIFLFGDNEENIRMCIPPELLERMAVYSAGSLFQR